MAGLGPAIHAAFRYQEEGVDPRAEPEDDGDVDEKKNPGRRGLFEI